MTGVPGAGAVARLILLTLAIGAPCWSGAATARVVARQEAPPAPIEVGAGPVRERSLALVGRTVYRDDAALMFGYVTDVIGLDPALLFTGTPPSALTARFTYAGEIPLSSNTNRGDITAFAGEGTIGIFFDDDAGADWNDPGSFADGEPVAALSLRSRDTLQRQEPGVGVVVGDAPFRQDMAGEFAIGGETYRFGQSGIEGRLRTIGALIGSEREPGLAIALTGSASVTEREATPVIAGEAAP